MKTGMLWFDNDNKTDLPTKIQRAADYYHKKYGIMPDLCFVHPSMIPESSVKAQGIEVKTARTILPNHLWLGIHEAMTASN